MLLRAAPGEPRGFVAKIADFGLSVRLAGSVSHVSGYHVRLRFLGLGLSLGCRGP